MTPELSPSGIDVVGDMPWGMHYSVFYESRGDLLDVIIPYFATGLDAGELCVWMPSDPSAEAAAIEGLRARVRDFDGRVKKGDIVFSRYSDFFDTNGHVDTAKALSQWQKWDVQAREGGYAGLRGSGNPAFLDQSGWKSFNSYEQALHDFLTGRRMRVVCSYSLETLSAADVLDAAKTHHFVLARRGGGWEFLEVPELKRTKDELQRINDELEHRVAERTSELATANEELQAEIDERRRVEEDLRRTETYLEHGQRLSHSGSYAIDPASREFSYWSAETFRIFGLEPTDRPPTRAETYEMIHPADRERVQRMGREAIVEHRDVEMDFRVIWPNGDTRYVHLTARPVPDTSGGLVEVVGSLLDVTERKHAAVRLANVKRVARERTLEHRFAATLEERTRLAREIHDSLLQGVTGIALQLRATLPNLGQAPLATVESIRQIVELADSTVRDARRAVWDIRAPALAQKGLPVALEEELPRIADGIHIAFTVEGAPRPLSSPLEDTIFRIGQEAVINAKRHSGAKGVSVVLTYRPRSVRLTVRDDGRGFRVDPKGRTHGGRWGLLGMRERAERIGASLTVRSEPEKGTMIELRVRSVRTAESKEKPALRGLTRAS
ncbi:MAG: sensory transduction histidine kinase [Gemmatimonadetes bacterium]|nr:sensory transduction histidine kinase [Gemmatimonadota bacterium]